MNRPLFEFANELTRFEWLLRLATGVSVTASHLRCWLPISVNLSRISCINAALMLSLVQFAKTNDLDLIYSLILLN